MPQTGKIGTNFVRPAEFLLGSYPVNVLFMYQGVTQRARNGAAGFFTAAANAGVNDNTNWAANTFKAILNVPSGAGLMHSFIGPSVTGAGETTTLEITADGILKTFTFSPAAGECAFAGALPSFNLFTTAANLSNQSGTLNAGKNQLSGCLDNMVVPSWGSIRTLGTPCLQFSQSLLVRAKHSVIITATAADERQSAVIYMLEQ